MIILTGQGMAADVKVIPSDYLATQGKTFEFNITIDPEGAAIAGAQLNIAFDKSNIRINKITEGDFLKQNGTNTFFSGGIINNSTGTVNNIFGVVIGKKNVSDPGTFITINATAIGSSGTSPITISNVKISDSYSQVVPPVVYNGNITINSPPALDAVGNRTVAEGQILTFNLSAYDANADALTYSTTNLPPGAVFFTENRTFRWAPDFTQSGNYRVHFEVYDGALTDFEDIMINVNNVYPGYDVNENGVVDIGDLTIIGQHFNEMVNVPYPRYDVNMDGIVDISDITIAAQHFGENT